MITERFAPSPTGLLHLGHAWSAWLGWTRAQSAGGRFLLRMEDLDKSRIRPEFYTAIQRDLDWLGIFWDGDILCQSTRHAAYAQALARLDKLGLTYRCTCTRRDIQDAISAPQEGSAPRSGPDGLVYPGTCRTRGHGRDEPHAIRLNISRALEVLTARDPDPKLFFDETGQGPDGEHGEIALVPHDLIDGTGDIVLARRDSAPAYHLAVVVDDAHQGVTHVTRGQDLFSATPVQRLLQGLLGLPAPVYHHHSLVRDETGRRLAKRDDARSIQTCREAGLSPTDVLELARATARARD